MLSRNGRAGGVLCSHTLRPLDGVLGRVPSAAAYTAFALAVVAMLADCRLAVFGADHRVRSTRSHARAAATTAAGRCGPGCTPALGYAFPCGAHRVAVVTVTAVAATLGPHPQRPRRGVPDYHGRACGVQHAHRGRNEAVGLIVALRSGSSRTRHSASSSLRRSDRSESVIALRLRPSSRFAYRRPPWRRASSTSCAATDHTAAERRQCPRLHLNRDTVYPGNGPAMEFVKARSSAGVLAVRPYEALQAGVGGA